LGDTNSPLLLKNKNNNIIVFEIPPLSNYRGMFYQTIHENKLIGGFIYIDILKKF
jgi:hypothetical protein